MGNIRDITDAESRSYKSAPVRVDYRGKVNTTGMRVPTGGSVPGRGVRPGDKGGTYSGKGQRKPKGVIRSGRPDDLSSRGLRYAPGYTRGMGYSENGGYVTEFAPDAEPQHGQDVTTLAGMRAARDFYLARQRESLAGHNPAAAERYAGMVAQFRRDIRRVEKESK
ncbi:hypothetical protein ACFVGM_09115 [Kitasatospora purpeofusca]|uniref:hypothetical protein n=1 Tax=Kitasatospora purpeofusca TaxID=67352 RepID=UPI00367719E2